MATDRAEQILSAVKTLVTGLTTTRQSAYRGRIYNYTEDSLPAVGVYQDGTRTEFAKHSYLDHMLSITIELMVKEPSEVLDTKANLIKKEIHAAMMADYTLGLSFVINTIPKGDEGIEFPNDESPVAVMKTLWDVHFRTSLTDLSA